MDNLVSPWVSRFEPLLDVEEIKRKAYIPASPIQGFGEMPTEVAVGAFIYEASRIYVPTHQACEILRTFIEVALSHSQVIYPDRKTFLAGCYTITKPTTKRLPICFTGPAGVGKSALVKALKRIVPSDSKVIVDDRHASFQMSSMWYMEVKSRIKLGELLFPFYSSKNNENEKELKSASALKMCKNLCYLCGVGINIADELQHLTTSTAATAQIVKILLYLLDLGAPLVYVSNFSLCWRLMKRNDEDKQRLLSSPMLLLPELPTSSDYKSILNEIRNIAPDDIMYDPSKDAEEIHRYTGGSIRRVISLISVALRQVRNDGGDVIDMRDIEQAYYSMQFTSDRNDVEEIMKHAFTGDSKRKDLICPFDIPKTEQQKQIDNWRREYKNNIAQEILKSSMTPEEKQAYEELTDNVATNSSQKDKKGPKVSKNNMLQGLKKFRGNMI